MSETIMMWIGLFVFGMFVIYLIAEGVHIIVIKDKEKIKEVVLGIIAIPANLFLLWLLLKIPFPAWMKNYPYISMIITAAIWIAVVCLIIKLGEKRKQKNEAARH